MSGNTFGNIFKVTSFGESHGEAMGVVIDGMPPNIEVDTNALQQELDRRRPGAFKFATSRNEPDKAIILSGVFQNKTLGTPIAVIIKNTNQKSEDYKEIKSNPRVGHADQTTLDKFGIKDHRGGGRASGRETVSRVIAGYFAGLIIPTIKVHALITQIGELRELNGIDKEVENYLFKLKTEGESAGGEVAVSIKNVPKGLGDPCFDKLKATLSHALLSIGSCMGISFGIGEEFKSKLGSEISTDRENFGGIEGGISNGEEICLKLIFKAPSTVGKNAKEGRHDPCILPRVVPVIESMIKITLCDHYLMQKTLLR